MQLVLTRIKFWIRENPETLLYVLLGLITFSLSINFSKDWVHYNFMFGQQQSKSWQTIMTNLSLFKEPLYLISSKAIGYLVGFTAFALLATISFLTVKLHFLKKITGTVYVGLFFYICLYLLLHEGTALRVAYAVALLVPALYFIKVQKFHYSLILILIASQIHITALVFLLAFPAYLYKQFNILVYLLFLISPLVIVLEISILNILKELIITLNPKYSYYFQQNLVRNQNSTGLYFYFIAFFALLMFVISFYLKDLIKKDRFISMLFSLCLVGIILMCIFYDYVPVGARFGELLLMPIVVLLSHLYIHFSDHKMLIHQLSLVSIFFIYFMARLVYLYPTAVGL